VIIQEIQGSVSSWLTALTAPDRHPLPTRLAGVRRLETESGARPGPRRRLRRGPVPL